MEDSGRAFKIFDFTEDDISVKVLKWRVSNTLVIEYHEKT